MFKKHMITIIALICAVISLIVSIFAIGAAGKMKNQLDKLTNDLNILMLQQGVQSGGTVLESWELKPAVWADGTGADITLTAVPANYTEGMSAQLNVCFGQEVNAVQCQWNGKAFVATASVAAEDGYTYILVLDGEELELASPANPAAYIPVYLQSSLGYNCTLMINGWESDMAKLKLTDAHLQVNLPLLATDGGAKIQSTALVMRLGIEEVNRKELTMKEGEGEGSFELTLQNFNLTLPEMQENDQVDLWLEVTLSDGQVLLSATSSWYLAEGKLTLVAG